MYDTLTYNNPMRTTKILLRVTPQDKAEIQAAAQAAGLSLSTFVRWKCLAAHEDVEPATGTVEVPQERITTRKVSAKSQLCPRCQRIGAAACAKCRKTPTEEIQF